MILIKNQATSHSGRGRPSFFRHVAWTKHPRVWLSDISSHQISDLTWGLAKAGTTVESLPEQAAGIVSLKVCLCVCQLSSFLSVLPFFLPQSLLEPNSVKWVSKLKKKHPVVVLNLLVLGQRDPECYDFDGRGSAQPEFVGGVISGWLILVLLGWKNTGFQWGLAKISKFPNFCLKPTSQDIQLGWAGFT